jgi:hypothetical protein
MVFPLVLASLLLAYRDVPVVSAAAVTHHVAVVLSAHNVPGVLAVARVSTLLLLTLWRSLLLPVSILLLTCLLLLVSPAVLAPLLLLASFAVPDVSYAAVGPVLLFLPWISCCG